MKKLKVGIIGCGAIGTAIACALKKDFKQVSSLDYVCERHDEKVSRLKKTIGKRFKHVSIKTLIAKSDLIIEAASVKVVRTVLEEALKNEKQVMVLSAGGLLHFKNLKKILQQAKGRLWVPSGAIAGVDGLLACGEGRLRSVKLITRKSPKGLSSAPYFKTHKFPVLSPKAEKCIFKGSAAEAIKGFPKNVNVAALLSLAGLGDKKTKVEIWTSRLYKRNRHEIDIQAESGSIKVEVQNKPSKENAKTSALAFLSAIATLRRIFSNQHIGT